MLIRVHPWADHTETFDHGLTRIERIYTDLIRENPLDPLHPRPILYRVKPNGIVIGHLNSFKTLEPKPRVVITFLIMKQDALAIPITKVGAFFMKTDPVHTALVELGRRLDQEGISYALVGAMALGYHGFVRVTQDIDLLMTREDLKKFNNLLVGRGYTPAFAGAKRHYKETSTGVRIDVIVSGEYPGDGKPKPVSFPDPSTTYEVIEGLKVLSLPKLIELKLASGLSAPHRISDLGDVQKLIELASLPRELSDSLDPSVRREYLRLWEAIRKAQQEHLGPDRE